MKLPNVWELAKKILEAENIIGEDDVQMMEEHTMRTPQKGKTRKQRKIREEGPQEKARKSPQGYTPLQCTRQNNPPFLTGFMDRNKYKCLGCNKWVCKNDYPTQEIYFLH